VQPRPLTSAIIYTTVTGSNGTSKVNTPPPLPLEQVPRPEPEPPLKSTLSGVLAPEAGVKDVAAASMMQQRRRAYSEGHL
jgi:hypothetical protein